ncbi:MAG: hypothetical protein AVDCRST_MAG54-1467 [uncultured Actinomycetospora sp.]|uniref:Uncharacterized protein n=1 Tax=uncultured Actinomycetospora sp. TaxID=1135996 RepID=A0A6J4I1U7_9PSEU|nr:MAG: hypothetical protein AVDCRST_MAG54-1467 [uncultured Actinomycetospora sp.]
MWPITSPVRSSSPVTGVERSVVRARVIVPSTASLRRDRSPHGAATGG